MDCLWAQALGQSVFDVASNMSHAFWIVWFGDRIYCWRIDENRVATTVFIPNPWRENSQNPVDLIGHCWLFTPDLCHHGIDEQVLQAQFHPHFARGVANALKDTGRITLQNVEMNSRKNGSELWQKF